LVLEVRKRYYLKLELPSIDIEKTIEDVEPETIRALYSELTDATNSLHGVLGKIDFTKVEKRRGRVMIDKLDQKILAFGRSLDRFTSHDVVEKFGISPVTANRRLRELTEAGELKRWRVHRSFLYQAVSKTVEKPEGIGFFPPNTPKPNKKEIIKTQREMLAEA
jgi:ribosomal protein S25